MSIVLDRVVFHGPAPQALFLLDSCGDELDAAIGLARIQFMYAGNESDEKKWAEIIHLLRENGNLC